MASPRTSTSKLPLGKVIGAGVAALAVIVVLASTVNVADTAANQIGLHYGGGLVEDKTFKGIVPVGTTNKIIGPGDTVYLYPIDQRSYIIGGAGADTGQDDEVTVVSKDNVRLGVRVQVYFTLNRTPKTVELFHERIGLKTEAYSGSGWDRMLAQYFRPQIDRSLAAVAVDYTWQELYNDETKKAEFQNAAAKEFSRLLPQAATTSVGRPTPAATPAASCPSRSRSRRHSTRPSSRGSRPSSRPTSRPRRSSRRTSRSRPSSSRSRSRWTCSDRTATC